MFARSLARYVRIAPVALAAMLAVAVALTAPGPAPQRPTAPGSTAASSLRLAATGDPVLAVGGDIACPPGKTVDATHCGQGKTGAVVTSINPNYVIPLGDTQYDSGTPTEYAGSYTTTGWGTEKTISRPAAGNHEYRTTGATGYYGYFGANAGDPQKGYYSWDVPVPAGGSWHMIALNSECSVLGGGSISAGCGAGSTQEKWLKADLAAHPNVCTLAYWHRPRFSSSPTTPSSTTYTAFWNDLYAAGADVVLNGHAHNYERFAPQTSAGVADPKGLTEYVVGTGGENFQSSGPLIANSVKFNNSAFGAMKMTLHSNSYDFQFVPAAGYTLSDSGTNIPCHTAPAGDTTKPSAPTNVTATASSANQVNLGWTAATDNVGVKNYQIYRGSNGATPTLLTTTTTNATTFTDTTVTANTPYTYQVYAQDAAGNIGPASNTASVTTPASADTTRPTAPSALAAEQVFYNEIDLGWTGSTDSGTGVSGYKVYRQGPGESTFTLLATQPGTGAGHNSYVDTTVKPSSSYQYFVTAYDGANNESAHSNTVSSSTPAGPSSQTFTYTAAGDATIQQASPTVNAGTTSPLTVDNSPVDDALLKFNVVTSGCESLTSAKLTLKNNANGSVKGGDFYTTGPNWTESGVNWSNAPTRGALLNSLGAVASGATATVDVTQGVSSLNGEADFRIGSTSSDGVTYQSREGTVKPTLTVVCATSATVPDTQPPTAPTNLTGTAANSGEVDLSWAASTDNIGVTNYDIYRGGVLVGTVPGGSAQGSSLTYQDTTVAPSTTYSYTVKARDAANNSSAASNIATATTPAAQAPAAPTNLAATATSGTSVNLTWTASTSPNVTGYNIYRGPAGGTLTKINSSGTSPFTDTTAVAGTAYDYAVTAVATGSPESAKSNTVTVTTPGSGGGSGGITAGTAAVTRVTTAATTWTVNLPTYAPGDFMVVWLGNNLGSTAGTPTSSGWTAQQVTNESSGLKGSFLSRRMATGDPTSITVSWGGSTLGVAEAVPFTGVNTTTPVDVKGGQAEASTTAVVTHSTPSVTTTTANDVLVSGFTTDNASTWSPGSTTGTELADAAAGTVSAATYYSSPVTAGSYARSATATTASVKAVSALLALKAG
jgi:fibronectin type 3 domain-containing protein